MVLKAFSLFNPGARMALKDWKRATHYDTSRTEALLGRKLQDPYDATMEMAASLVDLGLVKQPPRDGPAPEHRRQGGNGVTWLVGAGLVVWMAAYLRGW